MISEDSNRIVNCIVGLGNPGFKYRNTRHNVGFMIIDALARRFKSPEFVLDENFIYSPAEYNSKNIILLKPVTFMNLSGIAVKQFLDKTNLPLEKIIVISDDINIPFGTLRLRPSGSDGGQKGLGSIIYEIMSDEFPRLRFGISNSEEQSNYTELADFVLSEFSDEEKKELDNMIEKACDAILCHIDNGISAAMNNFNRNYLAKPGEINGENNDTD